MPTPVGPAPRDPNDPDFWDWGDSAGNIPYTSNGGHDDSDLVGQLARRRRQRRFLALGIVLLLLFSILITVF